MIPAQQHEGSIAMAFHPIDGDDVAETDFSRAPFGRRMSGGPSA
jgi:hypothetical protein